MFTKINDFQPGRIEVYDEAQQKAWFPDIVEPEFWKLAEKHWDFTALGASALYNLYNALRYVVRRGLPGAYVECGVFLGGSVMFAADTLLSLGDSQRRIYACDTFCGFVSRTDKDVDMAGNPVCEPGGERNWRAEAEANIRSVPYPEDRLIVVEGDVAETLATIDEPSLCAIRLDTDTYETTLLELRELYPLVVPGGVVIVDDFGWNQGARIAVEEYFSEEPVLTQRVDLYCRSIVKV